jgi:VCBS repeat-containing protein
LTAILVAGPTKGTLTAFNPDGSFTYRPNADFDGQDTFTYRTNDGGAESNVATVTVSVSPVNDAPVAVNDLYSAGQSSSLTVPVANGVLKNDTDVDSTALTATLVRAPANGTLTLNADGSFTYTPSPSFTGQDNFTYRASDSAGGVSNVATVTITSSTGNPWQNPRNRFDVNNDGSVSPIDVLVVVNDLNARGARVLPIPPVPPFTPPPFLDVNGDRSVTPQDALSVINLLNSGGSEGESGEYLVSTFGSATLESSRSPVDAFAVVLPVMIRDTSPFGESAGTDSRIGPTGTEFRAEGTIPRSIASNVPVTRNRNEDLDGPSLQTDGNWDDLLAILADGSTYEPVDETDLALAELFGQE